MRGKIVAIFSASTLLATALSGCSAPAITVTPEMIDQGYVSDAEVGRPTVAAPGAHLVIASLSPAGDQMSFSGYVEGVVESGGICSYTAVSGSTSLEFVGEGRADAANTSCGFIEEPIASFAAGSWAIQLHYVSDSLDIRSETRKVLVP